MTTLLVPIDGSEHTSKLLTYLTELAAVQKGVEVILLYVSVPLEAAVSMMGMPDNPMSLPGFSPLMGYEEFEKIYKQQADNALNPALKTLTEAGIAARCLGVTGYPALEIVNQAVQLHVDGIVMGTHGQSALSASLLGSVAQSVMQHTPCPLTFIR